MTAQSLFLDGNNALHGGIEIFILLDFFSRISYSLPDFSCSCLPSGFFAGAAFRMLGTN
jgi:hypothetical protein